MRYKKTLDDGRVMKATCRLSCFLLGLLLSTCKPGADPAPIISTATEIPSQSSLVSVQPIGSTNGAEVVVKYARELTPADWQLTAESASGAALVLQPQASQGLDPFTLATFRVSGLTTGQAYRFRLRFIYNKKDTITTERVYRHADGTSWQRLAHIPAREGQFTGMPAVLNIDRFGSTFSVVRYIDPARQDALLYSRSENVWREEFRPLLPPPRQGMLQFILYLDDNTRYRYFGAGYQTSDLFPGKYVYLKDLWAITPLQKFDTVFPSYGGEDGEIAVFTTYDRAFLLTQNGSPAMRSIYVTYEQEPRRPLPERTGFLATFTIGAIGYVVNQLPGQPAHLFAYNTTTDTWTRKADFPGPGRFRGVAFSAKGKGYFGLGATQADEQGLRDLWEYDPAGDRWRYVTDYPGQGHRYLIALSTPERAYLGWGYESQTVVGSEGARLVGCTDFWEFTP